MRFVFDIPLTQTVGRINKRHGTFVSHNKVWRVMVSLGIGENRGGRWFLRPEDEDTLAEALGLLRPQQPTGG